jgi:hypothetical protein
MQISGSEATAALTDALPNRALAHSSVLPCCKSVKTHKDMEWIRECLKGH